MSNILDTVSTHLEQVRPTLARYYDQSVNLSKYLKPKESVKASRYLYRIPFVQYIGGTYKKYVADGGDMGSGSALKTNHLEAGFFDTTYNIQITKEQMDYMKQGGAAILDVLSEMLAQGMTEVDNYDEINLFGDGTGKYTNPASSSPSSTQLIFNSSSDTLGVNRIRMGMVVDVWDSTAATQRAGGPYTVTNVDYNAKTVTFSSAVTGIQSTDLLAVFDADAYGPSTLTSFSSTWPGGGLTNAPGLTGDSFRHGLPYANDATTSNYYLGRQKSSFSQLLPSRVNAQSSALTFAHGELVKNLIIQRRDETVLDGMMAVMHQAQVAQLKDEVTAISTFFRSKSDEMIDIQPTGGIRSQFMFADVPSIYAKRQDKARVDYFNPTNWFRVEGHPTEFFDFGGGITIRSRTVGSNGNTAAAYEIKIVQKMDTGCLDPGAGAYIDNLAVPTNY